MRIGFVDNPRSERNRRGHADILAVLDRFPTVERLAFDGRRDLGQIARDLATARADLVVVNGGDGTVQGLLTEILEDRRFDRLPAIAILPRGMANMTAKDCGLRRRGPAALRTLLATALEGDLGPFTVRRHVLRVANLVEAPAARGMFMGALGIYDAIRHCKTNVHSKGLKGEMAHLTTLASLLWATTFGTRPPGLLEGEDAAIETAEGLTRQGRMLLIMATTLDRLVLGSRPFWNTAGRPVRFTAVDYPAPRVLRHLLSVLYGGDRRRLPEGYWSTGSEAVQLRFTSPFTIDGQFFTPRPHEPVIVTAPDELRFVRI